MTRYNQNNKLLQKGFTLVELLVAITVFAVLSAIIYQTFLGLITAKEQVDYDSEGLNKWQRTWYWLGDDLFHAIPRHGTDELGTLVSAMVLSTDNKLYFSRYVPYPTPTSKEGIIRVGYSLEDDVLYRLSWVSADLADASEPTKQKLLDNITSIEIRLLDKTNIWNVFWPPIYDSDVPETYGQTDLPQVAEITLEHQDKGSVMRRFPLIKGGGL